MKVLPIYDFTHVYTSCVEFVNVFMFIIKSTTLRLVFWDYSVLLIISIITSEAVLSTPASAVSMASTIGAMSTSSPAPYSSPELIYTNSDASSINSYSTLSTPTLSNIIIGE